MAHMVRVHIAFYEACISGYMKTIKGNKCLFVKLSMDYFTIVINAELLLFIFSFSLDYLPGHCFIGY